MHSLQELQILIVDCASQKDLINRESIPQQKIKLIEECGELAGSILKNNIEVQKDSIGDVFVVLVILSVQKGRELEFDGRSKSIADTYEKLQNLLLDAMRYDDIEAAMSYANSIAKDLGFDLTECANIAWNEIKNRTGKTINGTFIKD